MEYFFLFIGFGFFILLFAFWKYSLFQKQKKKKLNTAKHLLQKVKNSDLSDREKILEYDKILDLSLSALGYSGTTGNKMKQYGKRFANQNNIWISHKLRNRIAHEIDFSPSEKEFKKAERSFCKEVNSFI